MLEKGTDAVTDQVRSTARGWASQVVVTQLLSGVLLFVTPWTVAHQASLFLTISQSLLKPMSIKLVMSSNHFILCCPYCLLPSITPSIRVFSNESVLCIRWPKYWSFIFSIGPSSEYSGLVSFRIDCFWTVVLEKTLETPLDYKEIQPVHPKRNQS